MRRSFLGFGVLAFLLISNGRPALAQQEAPVTFWGGPMRNLYIDLVFWGFGETISGYGEGAIDPDAKAVMNAVQDIASSFNTGWMIDDGGTSFAPPFGWEPAVHTYGVAGIQPGLWVNDSLAISDYMQFTGITTLGDSDFQEVVRQAWARQGFFGSAQDFENNTVDGAGLTGAPNRLTLVVTKGTNSYNIDGTAIGYHSAMSNNLYGAVMSESMYQALSHEIMEAMTDPYPFDGQNTWNSSASSGFLGSSTTYSEIADNCQQVSFNEQYTLSWITVDPSYNIPNSVVPVDSCLQYIPEQHAPMAATFEYGYRSQPLDLVYIDVQGHVEEMEWDSAGGAASAPFDLGPPSATVAAAGKPSIVYSLYTGERIFVKGTDNALWMHWEPNGGTGQWMSLGGVIYGDPKAVIWDNDQLIDVFALGTDDNIYYYGMTPSVFYGWSGLYWSGKLFVNSPTVLSRDGQSLDLFANGEDAQLYWMSCNSTTCWTNPQNLTSNCANCDGFPTPTVGTPTVAFDSNHMELFTDFYSNCMRVVTGPNWGQSTLCPGTATSSVQGSMAPVSWGPGHFDAFSVSREGELWWWKTNNPGNLGAWTNGTGSNGPLVGNSNGPNTPTGDPLAISRSANEVEVFYRTDSGQLAHLTYNNGAWGALEINLPATFSPTSMR